VLSAPMMSIVEKYAESVAVSQRNRGSRPLGSANKIKYLATSELAVSNFCLPTQHPVGRAAGS
jgi:hypothetical protein